MKGIMFKKVSLSAIAVLIAFAITGCDEAKSVDWFKDHPSEMNEVLAKCKASGDDSQNCRNAKEARQLIQQKDAAIPTYN